MLEYNYDLMQQNQTAIFDLILSDAVFRHIWIEHGLMLLVTSSISQVIQVFCISRTPLTSVWFA